MPVLIAENLRELPVQQDIEKDTTSDNIAKVLTETDFIEIFATEHTCETLPLNLRKKVEQLQKIFVNFVYDNLNNKIFGILPDGEKIEISTKDFSIIYRGYNFKHIVYSSISHIQFDTYRYSRLTRKWIMIGLEFSSIEEGETVISNLAREAKGEKIF